MPLSTGDTNREVSFQQGPNFKGAIKVARDGSCKLIDTVQAGSRSCVSNNIHMKMWFSINHLYPNSIGGLSP